MRSVILEAIKPILEAVEPKIDRENLTISFPKYPGADVIAALKNRKFRWTGSTWKAPSIGAIESFEKKQSKMEDETKSASEAHQRELEERKKLIFHGDGFLWADILDALGVKYDRELKARVAPDKETLEKAIEKTTVPKRTEPTRLYGYGGHIKDTLRRMGCWFDDLKREWMAPNKEVAEAAQKKLGPIPENIPIHGDTRPHKEQLKVWGCRWDGTQWLAPTKEVAEKANKLVNPPLDPGVQILSQGSGYGGRAYKKGEVIRNPKAEEPRYLYVLEDSKSRYYREDGMSFGVGDEEGYVYKTQVRAATDEESAKLRSSEERHRTKHERQTKLQSIFDKVFRDGTMPEKEHDPHGERLYVSGKDSVIYGGGSWFVIEDDDRVWAIRNNGMDGDDWSRNNIKTGGAGAIGKYMDNADLAKEIRELAKDQ